MSDIEKAVAKAMRKAVLKFMGYDLGGPMTERLSNYVVQLIRKQGLCVVRREPTEEMVKQSGVGPHFWGLIIQASEKGKADE